MLGAIIGDIVGSRWEFNPTNDYDFEFFSKENDFTDDSICTIAIADALLKRKDFGVSLHSWCNKYPHPMGSYGGRFLSWVLSNNPQAYGSFGNGSAMRVSPVAWLSMEFSHMVQTAAHTAFPTHNHPEGIKGAQAVAIAIHDCLKLRYSKVSIDSNQIKKALKRALEFSQYNIDIKKEDVQNHFDETCQGTVPVAFWIITKSNSFEDAIRKAISLGADADTLGAIVGSIAEAIWGIPSWIKEKAISYLPKDMRDVLTSFRKRVQQTRKIGAPQAVEEIQKAMMFWKLSFGNPNEKLLRDSSVKQEKTKKAAMKDFKVEPMPKEDGILEVDLNIPISKEEMEHISFGHIPDAMEDHWLMITDDAFIRYYRSWTLYCAFEAKYSKKEDGFKIEHLRINANIPELCIIDEFSGISLFRYLLAATLSKNQDQAWNEFLYQEDTSYYYYHMKKNDDFYEKPEFTPDFIKELKPNEVFVFGSNLMGAHVSGAARIAHKSFGAVWGKGVGAQGQSYAIPTMHGGIDVIKPYVDDFITYAKEHKDKVFLVTRIGCGIAGFKDEEMAPLFLEATKVDNIVLPKSFVSILNKEP